MTFEIVVPIYNEASRVDALMPPLARAVCAFPIDAAAVRFWWADDGSTDGSLAKIEASARRFFEGTRVEHVFLRQEKNQGKGSIVRHALGKVLARASADAVVAFWDADGELDPTGLYEGLSLVARGEADVAFAYREWIREGGPAPGAAQFASRKVANRALTMFSNLFSGLVLRDAHCCARVARAGLLARLPFASRGFDFEAEFAGLVGALARREPLRLAEFRLAYRPRTAAQGRKIGIRDVYPQVTRAIRCWRS